MGKRRRIEITSFSERTIVVRSAATPIAVWCDACFGAALMVTPDEAAGVARVSPRVIYRWVEARKVHFIEGPGGSLLICLASVRASALTHLDESGHDKD